MNNNSIRLFSTVVLLLISLPVVDAQWIQTNGPYGGEEVVNNFAFNGSQSFAATPDGVFLSNDNGDHWSVLRNGLPDLHIQSVGIAGSLLLCGSGDGSETPGGICVSTDNGASWSVSNNGVTDRHITNFITTDKYIFAGSQGGIYRSSDGAATWQMLGQSMNCSPRWIVLDAGTLYTATDCGVFYSTDDGDSWIQIDPGKLHGGFTLCVYRSDLYIGTYTGILRYSESGGNWQKVSSALAGYDVRTLVVSGATLFVGTQLGGLFRTMDGNNWEPVNSGFTAPANTAITLATNGTDVFAGTWGGAYRTTNGGATWQEINAGLSYSTVLSMTVSGGNLTAASTDGLQISTDDGNSWTVTSQGRGMSFIQKGNEIFSGLNGDGILRSTNAGQTWSHTGLWNEFVYPLAVTDAAIFAGLNGSSGLLRSTDDGHSWMEANTGLTNHYIYALTAIPGRMGGTVLFAASYWGGVFRSTDDGASWVNTGLENASIRSFALLGSTLYAGEEYRAVYSTTDEGATWQNMGAPGGSSLLVVGDYIFGGSSAGVMLSTDKGLSWQSVNTGLTKFSVHSLALKWPYLYAGLEDGGVWKRSVYDFFGEASWKIVSVPNIVPDFSVAGLFPNCSSDAFIYRDPAYIVQDTLMLGHGYWLRYNSLHPPQISGTPVAAETIAVAEGWNLVGSIGTPLPVAAIGVSPSDLQTSPFYRYDGGYTVAGTLEPGEGYWVKADRNGTLILSSGANSSMPGRIRIVGQSDAPPPPPDNRSGKQGKPMPSHYSIAQNYPNPFNPTTTISYTLPVDSYVSLRIYNTAGQQIAILKEGVEPAGYREVKWDGGSVASGIYYFSIRMNSISDPGRQFSGSGKMMLLK